MLIKVTHGSGPRFDEDSPECVLDVAYECDTSGKYPSPGDAAAQLRLTEVQVPRARVQSREPGSEVFVGAAVRVTKIVQRTFEFVNGAAAAEALVTMVKNTPRAGIASSHHAHHASSKGGMNSLAEDSNDIDKQGQGGGGGGGSPDKAAASANEAATDEVELDVDKRFGLEHGGCVFEVARPLKVELHGLSDHHGEVGKGRGKKRKMLLNTEGGGGFKFYNISPIKTMF